jgi:hypothetical protein
MNGRWEEKSNEIKNREEEIGQEINKERSVRKSKSGIYEYIN